MMGGWLWVGVVVESRHKQMGKALIMNDCRAALKEKGILPAH